MSKLRQVLKFHCQGQSKLKISNLTSLSRNTVIKYINTFTGLPFKSPWHQWHDMLWTRPEFWGNRLQDWQIRDGKAICIVSDKNRSLYSLTCQLTDKQEGFESSVTLEWLNHQVPATAGNYFGFRIGAKGKFEDYRSAAVFGEGLDAGMPRLCRRSILAVVLYQLLPTYQWSMKFRIH